MKKIAEVLKKAAAKIAALGNFFRRQWKKIATVIAGHGIYSLIGWVYDNPLYIAVVAYFGPLRGGILMTIGSLTICFGFLFYYREKQVNWLGYDALDDLKERGIGYAEKLKGWREGKKILVAVIFFLPAMIFRIFMWCMKVGGDVIAFFVLCILEDPFITTAYLRHGVCNGLRKKDLVIFILSVLVSNGYWIARTTAIVEVARLTIKAIAS
ncbi:MAG: hypothetical protein PHF35_05125 [Candidatus Moranbacteria bacterium]|nr:hypothetical protein [Candidatus Moranbacteria bacterium]